MVEKKSGRPGEDGERFPCGKLRPRISGSEVKRILDFATHTARDRRFGSEVGRLMLAGKITPDEAATCFAIGDIYGAFDRFEGKRRAARSACYEIGHGRSVAVENTAYLHAHAEAKRRFRFLEQCLSGFPPRARTVIEALCVEDLSVNSGDPALLESLRALLGLVGAELARYDADERHASRVRRKSRRPSQSERVMADDYVAHSADIAPTDDAARRRRRREQRIGEILRRDAQRQKDRS